MNDSEDLTYLAVAPPVGELKLLINKSLINHRRKEFVITVLVIYGHYLEQVREKQGKNR